MCHNIMATQVSSINRFSMQRATTPLHLLSLPAHTPADTALPTGRKSPSPALRHTSAEAHLRISQCIISGNSAHAGGGIWLGDTLIVRLSGTRVSGNSARAYGGGVVLESSNFVRSQLEAATSGNQAKSEADISVWPTTITCLNDSTVENFVSRLNSEEGVVNVLLEVTGAQGLPSEGVVVVASLGGVNLKEQASGRDGMAFLPVKLRKPYGELLGCSDSLAATAAKAVCSSLAEYSTTI